MFEKLLAAILELTEALKANTAAQGGAKPARVTKPKEEKAEAAPTEKTPEPEKPAEKPVETPVVTTREELSAIAQSILDAAATKGVNGVEILKAVNTKHGFRASQADEQPEEKRLEFKKSLLSAKADLDKKADTGV